MVFIQTHPTTGFNQQCQLLRLRLLLTTSLVSVAAAAARFAASARPSGERATHSAASSAVAKWPRGTFLPPRDTCA